jgi:hypothetical protein
METLFSTPTRFVDFPEHGASQSHTSNFVVCPSLLMFYFAANKPGSKLCAENSSLGPAQRRSRPQISTEE